MPLQKSIERKNVNENKNNNDLNIPTIPAITTEFSQNEMNDLVIDDPKKQMMEI